MRRGVCVKDSQNASRRMPRLIWWRAGADTQDGFAGLERLPRPLGNPPLWAVSLRSSPLRSSSSVVACRSTTRFIVFITVDYFLAMYSTNLSVEELSVS